MLIKMKDYVPPRTDWVRLEVSLEIIGNMIAYHVSLLSKALIESPNNTCLIRDIEDKIDELGRERQACYVDDESNRIIEKAYAEYSVFLKSNSFLKTDQANPAFNGLQNDLQLGPL
jgi:hypothetical protein